MQPPCFLTCAKLPQKNPKAIDVCLLAGSPPQQDFGRTPAAIARMHLVGLAPARPEGELLGAGAEGPESAFRLAAPPWGHGNSTVDSHWVCYTHSACYANQEYRSLPSWEALMASPAVRPRLALDAFASPNELPTLTS